MIEKESLKKWLKNSLKEFTSSIYLAAIFGSLAKGTSNPNDCDLVIVTEQRPNSTEWKKLRNYLKELNEPFFENFGLKLSAVLLTKQEWIELKEEFFTHLIFIEFT